MLAYWNICDSAVDRAVDALDITSPECGFFWYRFPKSNISSSACGTSSTTWRSWGTEYALPRTRALDGWKPPLTATIVGMGGSGIASSIW